MSSDARFVLMVAGLVVGGIVTVAGLFILENSGPVVLIVGLVLLAFGGAALFTRRSGA